MNLVTEDSSYGEQQREYVKCIVVGDTGVGKTRLICSYIFDQIGLPLKSLFLKPHTPTVFAIDQYVVDPAVRRKSCVVVDGAPVQLQIWDTFGDHEKDRRFSFQNAHVVVLCFNIGSMSSLRNVNSKWYSEIKKYCPRVPIILVGTQLDRRHSDPTLFKHVSQITTLTDILNNSFKGLICKNKPSEIVKSIAPEVGRQTSREINASAYLESSIVTKHGVNEVFDSAIRAALINRRQGKPYIFSSSLKYIKKPGIQKPYLPEKLPEPEINVVLGKFEAFNFELLLNDSAFSDITFVVGSEIIPSHSIPLIASSLSFQYIFFCAEVSVISSQISLPLPGDFENQVITEEGYLNMQCVQLPRGYHSIDMSSSFGACTFCVKVINVDPFNFGLILEYLYTGSIATEIPDIFKLWDAANYLQEISLLCYLSNLISQEGYLNKQVANQFIENQRQMCRALLMEPSFFADVAFMVEGQVVPAHKQILVSQCKMMDAMFKEGGFKESMLQQV